jgi:hypothetical protein
MTSTIATTPAPPAGTLVTEPGSNVSIISNGDGTYSVVSFAGSAVTLVANDPSSRECFAVAGEAGWEKYEAMERLAKCVARIYALCPPDSETEHSGNIYFEYSEHRSAVTPLAAARANLNWLSFGQAADGLGVYFYYHGQKVLLSIHGPQCLENALADVDDEIQRNITWDKCEASNFWFHPGDCRFINPEVASELDALENVWLGGGND